MKTLRERSEDLRLSGNDFENSINSNCATPGVRLMDMKFSAPMASAMSFDPAIRYGVQRDEAIMIQRSGGSIKAIDAVEMLMDAELAMESGTVMNYSTKEKFALARASMRSTWIYFIVSVEQGAVKIGQAKNLAKRFNSLRGSSPCELTIAAAIRFVPDCEKWLHSMFSDIRMHGEWFAAEPQLIDLMRLAKNSGTRAVLEKIDQWDPELKCLERTF